MTLEELQKLSLQDVPRQRGDSLLISGGASLEEDFSLDEQLVIKEVYRELRSLLEVTRPDPRDKEAQFEEARQFIRDNDLLSLEDQLLMMMDETRNPEKRSLITQLSHGPLESVCAYIIFSRAGTLEPEYIQKLFYRARDQLKIMRRLIRDLDPANRARDEERKLHSVDLLLEKWRSTIYHAHAGEVQVEFEPYYSGFVAERCLEFAEIDRIFYHLINHCAVHSANKKLRISVAQARSGKDLIWAFSKKMTSRRIRLMENLQSSGETFFGAHNGSGGERLDLTIVADAVANAYGFEDNGEAERAGLFGAEIENGRITIWFHWPAVPE
jgi:hypothetical protein